MGVFEDVAAQYPSLAWLLNDPEVGALPRDAVDPNIGFSPQTFQAKLYETNWFQTRSTSQRSYDILFHTDPGEYRRQLDERADQVRAIGAKYGLNLDQNEITWFAATSMRNGLQTSSPEFNYSMTVWLQDHAQQGNTGKFGAGAIQGASQQVANIARNQYYVPTTDRDNQWWGIELAMGLKDESALREYLSKRAISLYPHLRQQLESGISMEDIFSGHRALIAKELEISPEEVDFTSRYNKVLQTFDPTNQQYRPMTLHETQTLARQEDRWWQTSGGRESDAGMANFMLKTFGKRA